MKTINRYPGVKPFEASDRTLFFGRDSNISDLCDLIRVEKLVVLFGKSGYGKSSLINAGVLPRLTAGNEGGRFLPVVIRFGEYIPDRSLSPVEMLRRKIAESIPASPDMDFMNRLQLPESLWLTLKRCQTTRSGNAEAAGGGEEEHPGFLLVFDQFEEFFSYPLDQQLDFRSQLADLLYEDIPEDVREVARTLTREQRRQLAASLQVRSLFAIRSDRLSELDRLKDRLPAILHKRYELKALSREQARDAIVEPAHLEKPNGGGEPDVRFYSPPFEYGADALEKILNDLAVSTVQGQAGVEAFQLQILCDNIESMVAAGKIPDRDGNGLPDVMADDLPDFTDVYGAYYERRLEMLPEAMRPAARLVIEDGLVRLDPATGEGRRLSMDADALKDHYAHAGASNTLLKELENTFLLRRERNTLGGYNYELSHDTLLAPVLRAKRQRMEAEERSQLARRRRRAAGLIIAGAALMFAALVASLWAINLYNDAKIKQLEADIAYKKLERTAFQVVEAFTREANNHIYTLDYKKATDRLYKAAALAQHTRGFKKAALEVAFFYNETEHPKEAFALLDTAGFFANRIPAQAADSIREFIQVQNPGWFDTLQQRYFPDLLTVPAGEFLFNDQARAEVSAFRLGKTEVTFWQMNMFDACFDRVRQMPVWGFSGDNPAVYVNWFDALSYANWLSGKRGLQPVYRIDTTETDTLVQVNWAANGYRLPTEVEWEYAARGGPNHDGFTYSGGNNLDEVAWWGNNSGEVYGVKRSNAVGTKKANSLGLYDMSGNVWEWCWDWSGRIYNRVDADYRGPESGKERVLRGGSWFLPQSTHFRCINRYRYPPTGGINVIGFRLAKNPD